MLGIGEVGGVALNIDMALSRLQADPSARYHHAAVGFGANLFVWGGNGGFSLPVPSSVIERFNILSVTWNGPRRLLGQSPPDLLDSMAVASDGERAYFFGGLVEPRRLSNALYVLDLSSLWCRKIVAAKSPSPRSNSGILYYQRKLVMYGGDAGEGPSDELFVFDLDSSES